MLDEIYTLRTPNVVSDEVGGETLAINLDTGAYYVIAPSALPVWRAISNGIRPSALLDDADDKRSAALSAFVEQVIAAGLVTASDIESTVDSSIEWNADGLLLQEFTDMADLLGLDPIHDADEVVGWPSANRPD
ncbi:MAG: hypothetical protein F2520_01485 [Actinobacteria bacterium]|uniref:Unannotated protein n=1 Tax=freshwater metagenome TaxID=449393 RepID=A0A6J5YDU8_9ZZZZ|nr:hypothetical protein [Actinomycetota bacterium]MTA76914.1 hypothetical protein [Actinomycetota bacterium]